MPLTPKSARRNIRVAPADDAVIRQAAAVVGESVSEFLIQSGRGRAETILADRTRFALDDQAWAAFTEALERPAEVKPSVVDLIRRSRPE